MIDTVILKLKKGEFQIKNEKIWQSYQSSQHVQKWTRNHSSQEKKHNIYRPRVTAIQRQGTIPFLKLEFSCPKILYQENLSELEEKDFCKVIEALQKNLNEIGISVFMDALEKAEVTAFHPSKNIVLTDGYTTSYVLKELSKINLNQRFDLNKTDFRHGVSLQGYTNAHSIVFYDKIADLSKPAKRAIDKDQTNQQMTLFQQVIRETPQLSVLRMEIRLSQKRKIKGLMKKLEIDTPLTFQDSFQNRLCQKVLLHYWEEMITNSNLFLFSTDSSPQKVLQKIIRQNSQIKPKEAIYLWGLYGLCRDEGGIRNLRKILSPNTSERSWYRVGADIKKLNDLDVQNLHGWIKQVENSLKNNKPYIVYKKLNYYDYD